MASFLTIIGLIASGLGIACLCQIAIIIFD